MPVVKVGTPLAQAWLSTHYPRLAAELDRVEGLAKLFADIAEAMDAYAENEHLDASNLHPEARVLAGGAVVIDLNPQTPDGTESQRWPSDGLPWEMQAAEACARVPGMAEVYLDIAQIIDNMARRNELHIDAVIPEAIVTPCGKIVISLEVLSLAA